MSYAPQRLIHMFSRTNTDMEAQGPTGLEAGPSNGAVSSATPALGGTMVGRERLVPPDVQVNGISSSSEPAVGSANAGGERPGPEPLKSAPLPAGAASSRWRASARKVMQMTKSTSTFSAVSSYTSPSTRLSS